jgi:hypothetical protein
MRLDDLAQLLETTWSTLEYEKLAEGAEAGYYDPE